MIRTGRKLALAMMLWAMIVAGPGVIRAQDGVGLDEEQRELLAFVNEARANMAALDSYHLQVERNSYTVTQFDLETGGNTIDSVLDVAVRVDSDHALQAAQGTYSAVIATIADEDAASFTFEITTDFVVDGDTLYQRSDSTQVDGPAVPFDILPGQGQWYVFTHEAFAQLYRFEGGSVTAYSWQLLWLPVVQPSTGDRFVLTDTDWEPVAPEKVVQIVELDGETRDGQSMRVFELTFDPLPVMLDQAAQSARLRGDDEWQADLDDATYQALVEVMRDYAFFSTQVWVGADDHLVHQVKSFSSTNYDADAISDAVTALGGSMPDEDIVHKSESHGETTYSDFDVLVEVIVPPDAIPWEGW